MIRLILQIPTMKGTSPLLLSSCMACFKVSPLRDNCSSVGRNLIFTREIKPAFSTEEWAYKKMLNLFFSKFYLINMMMIFDFYLTVFVQ